MRPLWLRTSVGVLVAGVLAFLLGAAVWPEAVAHPTARDIAVLAARMNIRNLVTAIYLGPRALDTFLEVMVVTLAVVGMRFVQRGIE